MTQGVKIKMRVSVDGNEYAPYEINFTEAKEAQPESSATACLAAGCGPNEETARRLAGWEARWNTLKTLLKTERAKVKQQLEGVDAELHSCVDAWISEIQDGVDRIEEADA